MCSPAIAVGVGMFALNAASGYAQGQAAEATAKYNARMQEIQAEKIKQAGNDQLDDIRRKMLENVSNARTQLAAGGVVADADSGLALQERIRLLGLEEDKRARNTINDQVAAAKQGAQLTLLEGKNAKRKAIAQGLLSGISSGVSAGMGAKGLFSGGSGATATQSVGSLKSSVGTLGMTDTLGRSRSLA